MRATAPCCSPQAVGPGVLVGAAVGVEGVAVDVAVGLGVAVGSGWLAAVNVGLCGMGILVCVFLGTGTQPAATAANVKIILIAMYWRMKHRRARIFRHYAKAPS